MTGKILCVDDEENVLRGFERNLRPGYEVETAVGPINGLKAVEERGPYAVVVADLRMPEMDGVQFLSEVRKRSPDTVRLILSGNADLNAAIASVNEGNVFRFLTKPFPADRLRGMLDDALKQHHLIIAERELLQGTLNGSIEMLTEVLSMVNPLAFSCASRIRRYVRHLATEVQSSHVWEYDLAAMLSHIGCIAVTPDILEKVYARKILSEEEQRTFVSHPSIGYGLVAKIPRLEVVGEIIRHQMTPLSELRHARVSEVVVTGAQMLKIAIGFDEAVSNGSTRAVLKTMRSQPEIYQASLVDAIANAEIDAVEMQVRTIYLKELQIRMVVNEDLRARNGLFLVAKGHVVSDAVLARLRNFDQTVGVNQPFAVLAPVSQQLRMEMPLKSRLVHH